VTSRPFVSGLLLAAGSATRFGRSKQLEKLGGTPLVSRAARALSSSVVDEVVVVVGNGADEVTRALANEDVRLVLNPAFRTGLSSSLRAGVHSLDSRSDAVVVCLGDQPFVTADLIDRIVDRYRKTRADAVAASSDDIISPPVLLDRGLFGEVARLRGDRGAKGIAMAAARFEKVEADPDALLDVDTEEELARAREILRERASRARDQAAGTRGRMRPS
jgi:molybdenum cofactor cytidylyltransferase